MIKKIALGFLSIFLLYGYSIAGNADSENKNQDKFGLTNRIAGSDTYVHRVTSSGHIVNEQVGVGELGSPTYYWGKIHTATGITRHNELFLDLPAKDHDVIMAGTALSTTTLVAAGTTYIASDLTQPSVPRNIVILSTGGVDCVGGSTATVSGTCLVKGINAVGVSTQEYITLVSTSDAAVGRGNVAWSHISSITISGVSYKWNGVEHANTYIYIGTSDKIGLVNDIASTSDIYAVTEAGTRTTTYTANSIFDTITFATAGNGSNDYVVRYIQKYFTSLP